MISYYSYEDLVKQLKPLSVVLDKISDKKYPTLKLVDDPNRIKDEVIDLPDDDDDNQEEEEEEIEIDLTEAEANADKEAKDVMICSKVFKRIKEVIFCMTCFSRTVDDILVFSVKKRRLVTMRR